MSTPPLPKGMADITTHAIANRLHSAAIHTLRHARLADAATELTPERLSLMSVLVYAGPQMVTSLARIEGVSVPAITRIVNALESDGYARRVPSPSDGRSVIVTATAAGRRIMEKARRARLARVAELLAGLDVTDLEQLDRATRVLDRLFATAH